MPRTNYVKSARKAQGSCEVCGKPIEPRMAYQYIEPRYGTRRVRHTGCRSWRPSEVSSSKMTSVWAAQEAFADAQMSGFDTVSDIAQAVTEVAEAARSVGEEYGESAQNIEDGFGHEVPMSEELREKADSLESWADELDSAASDIEGMEPVCAECSGSEDAEAHDHTFEPTVDHQEECAHQGCELLEDEHHDYEEDFEDIISEADSAINNCPV